MNVVRGTSDHRATVLVIADNVLGAREGAMRLNKALNTEAAMDGLLYPEVRANMELLDRMLARHFTTQQEIGMERKVTQGDKHAGHDDLDGGIPESCESSSRRSSTYRQSSSCRPWSR
jgi:hypothetical protein